MIKEYMDPDAFRRDMVCDECGRGADADEFEVEYAMHRAAGETGHGYVLDGVKLKFKAKYVGDWGAAK